MLKDSADGRRMVLMFTIVNRGKGEQAADLFAEQGVYFHTLLLGRGTASTTILDYLGLEEKKKDLILSVMPWQVAQGLMKQLSETFNLRKPGKGIAFTIPMESVCGSRTMELFCGETKKEPGGEGMSRHTDYELIIAVTNRGFIDEVVEAARSANAVGGTVLHARAVGEKDAEKFFGITVHPERELLLILADSRQRTEIMQSITKKTGLKTEAKTVTFSLPVSAVEGLGEPLLQEMEP